jgi:hypothetical protein
LANKPRGYVGRAAGGNEYNQGHRPRRIALRESEALHGRERGSTGGQMQKISTGKFH